MVSPEGDFPVNSGALLPTPVPMVCATVIPAANTKKDKANTIFFIFYFSVLIVENNI
jgi:hypothetical protein